MRPEQNQSLARRIAWADLLKRVFEVDAPRCPAHGERMRLIATITNPSVAHQILECLRISSRGPPLAPANEIDREPVVDPMAFEMTLAVTQSDPGFDSDQSSVEWLSPDDESRSGGTPSCRARGPRRWGMLDPGWAIPQVPAVPPVTDGREGLNPSLGGPDGSIRPI